MRDLTSVSVKDLAAFVHRRGDLFEPGGRVTADEGIKGQAALQKQKGECYQREVALSESFSIAEFTLTLKGRADGVDRSIGLVEEIKASRNWPEVPFAEHHAQALLYAALLSRQESGRETWRVQVTYVEPDSLTSRSFTEESTAANLNIFLQRSLDEWANWIRERIAHRRRRDTWLNEKSFPMTTLRPWQGAMIRRTSEAIRERHPLLLEAPTGSGKTLAVSWPAARALPNASRVLYLTSRNTGAAAALHALELIDGGTGHLKRIMLTAKEKICPIPGTPCDPEVCPNARGYYDRSRAAINALLQIPEATRDRITVIAREHQVCPFELSLDASVWFDVVIGDYNYVLDPVVRLQRFAGDTDAILLIDEAHQLAPRACSGLSPVLSRAEVRAAIPLAPAPIAKSLRSIDKVLLNFGKSVAAEGPASRCVQDPSPLLIPLQRLGESSAEWQRNHPLPLADDVLHVLFAAWRWLRLSEWFATCPYVFIVEGTGTALVLHGKCLDASPYLRTLWKQSGPVIRFSATVSPPALYQAVHGISPEEDPASFARAGSPFAPEQLQVLIVPDIDTRWRRRGATLPALVDLLHTVCAAKPGRYLMCFPSYGYLQQFADQFVLTGEAATHFVAQSAGQDTSLLQLLGEHEQIVLGIVLGGTLSESIDLIETPLAGVIVIGVAQSPPSLELERAAAHFDSRGLNGHLMAYIQPGMSKIVQAAGRLIRTDEHRGVLLLVDHRFRESTWQQFFPSMWEPRITPARLVGELVNSFWTNT